MRPFVLLLTGLLALPAVADAQDIALPPAVRQRLAAQATSLAPRLVETRRDIHRHPELGFRETRTAALIAERLRSLGFDEVRERVGVTGVVAVLKGGRPGKVVAIRADMDALPIPELIDVPYKSTVPNVKHACGHDGHVSIGLGVAEVLASMRAEIPGTVVFLFQPAEEGDPDGGLSGAQRMLDAGVFAGPVPTAVFGLHVLPTLQVGTLGVNVGAAMASSNRFTITITGKKTHAAYPHTGIDPVPVAAQVVSVLQTIPSRMNNAAEPIVVSVGTINGGNRFNIIADSVTLTGTVRTLSKDGPARVRAWMERAVKGVTDASGATYTFDWPTSGNPVTFNEETLAAASLPVLADVVGGRANILSPPPQMGAEDFALYQQKMPGLFFFLGVGNTARNITAMIHTEYFDMDEAALPIGVRALSSVALDCLYRK
ncbi:M20 family metallopeptidase [Luteitalea sp.]|uniref:M20 metallopeptidase family protein n=1 Tax=Luteitalea sp. TaxID=2004800 RepID=UPI0025C26ED1|nr:amidohydrolase [Luteitalea sp.]